MSYKGIFKDDSDDFESESGEDFSASEDEWKPGKDDAVSDEDDDNVANESDDDVSDDDDEGGGSKNKKSKKSRSKGAAKKIKVPKLSASSSKRRQPTSTLRSKLFRRYNPPPKTVSKSPIPSKVNDILSNSQYKSNKSLMQPPKDKTTSARAVFSDSESSDDDGLVDPNDLDFSSEFFDVKKVANRSNDNEESSAPAFDCNAGMKLSDSSDDDENDNEFTEVGTDAANTATPNKSSIINRINSKSGHEMHDFSSLQSFAKNLESAKAQMEKLKAKEAHASTSKANADESDITKLLSMGEGATTVKASTSSSSNRKRKHKDGQHSDDSDWENVSDNDEHVNEIKDIQITVGNTAVRQLTRDQKKAIDLEACLKRRLNREIKLKQVVLHKASVLCWIAHGNYINRTLNNMTLMEMCLKLLPSKNAYPKGDTDVKYYHMVTEWFHTLFQLKSDKLYCPLKKLPPKTLSLALQIQSKKIISKCDFVLLFVTMLRSLGIQCRLVINFAVPPQQPPQKDLFVISTKPKEEEQAKSNEKEKTEEPSNKKKKESTLAKKVKVSMENVKKSKKEEKPSTSTSNSPSKKIEKSPQSKASKSMKLKSNSTGGATDHSYAESHSFDKVKVKLSRMSQSFVAKSTQLPTTTKSSEHKSSQSPSSKSKKSKDSNAINGSISPEHTVSSTSSHVNGKSTKIKNVGNAEATTSKTQESPKKSSTNQSNDSLRTLTGTPIKHKLADRTNGNDVTKPFSPRKTRSKVGKVGSMVTNIEEKSKPMLPQSSDAVNDINDKKKAKQPKKLNMGTLNINVAALLPGAKPPKPAGKGTVKDNVINDDDASPASGRLVDLNRNRAKNLSLRPPTRAGLRQQYQNSVDSEELAGGGLKSKAKIKLPQLDGAHDDTDDDKKSKTKAKAKAKAKSRPKPEVDSNSDSDFEPAPPKRIRPKVTPPPAAKPTNKLIARAKKIDARVFSTDEENDIESNTLKMNFWVEAYAEKEKKWITIDPVKKKVDSVDYIRKHAAKPIIYVLAWNNDNTVRDVTPRYCSHFHTTTRKLRAEQLWIDDALAQFIEPRNPRTIIEDVEFSKLQMDTPLPTSINEFKNHPLYALERHLLKFEGIYPPNALTLGYIRNEPVYARDCVHTLHSREIWVKQARTVKVGEKPYKIVKARPKWNRMLNQMEEAKPLEIFGFWQTEPYQPPVAENGIVPRNPYGNVELFKPEMLPIGTRHLQLPNLNRVCRKMGVDCAQAVVGFDFHGGSSHPTFDGFVVCEEFADDVIKQWEIEQEEQIRKETEKREARVYGNWKKLIKGLLIRERLKRKFNFGVDDGKEKGHGGKRKKESK